MKIHGFKGKDTLDELDRAVKDLEDPFNWENYCSSCDNFETHLCPFRDKVNFDTEWKWIGCTNFWD